MKHSGVQRSTTGVLEFLFLVLGWQWSLLLRQRIENEILCGLGVVVKRRVRYELTSIR